VDLEELAAYADGRLDGERRAAVEARLARDEELYEMLVEAERFREEEEAGEASEQESRVFRLARPSRSQWLAVAAAAVVVIMVRILFLASNVGVATFQVADLAQELAAGTDLDARFGAGWVDDTPWTSWRGPEESDALRLGARMVALDAALRASDRDAASILVARIRESLPPGTTRRTYGDLGERLAEADRGELLELAGRAEAYLAEDLASPFFDLGRWAEAGRLAALAGDVEVLRRPAFRETLATLRTREEFAGRLEPVATRLAEEPLDTAAVAAAFAATFAEP
jgi:hypothetical protein